MTERQYALLQRLSGVIWVKPQKLGGSQLSDVSKTLRQLVNHGYAEKQERLDAQGRGTGAYMYRRTVAGAVAADRPRPRPGLSTGKVR